MLLSCFEDRKATRPSTLLSIYLTFSILFEATQVRTAWLPQYNHVAVDQSATVGIQIVMLFLEAEPKVPYLMSPYKVYPAEATSGFWNLNFVWWLNKLFAKDFRQLMNTQDLFETDSNLTSEVLD